MREGISAARYAERQLRAKAAVAVAGATALLVGVGPELEWLSGYAAHGGERLNLLVVPAEGDIVYLSPRLEAPAARVAPGLAEERVRIEAWEETDDPYLLVPALLPPSSPLRAPRLGWPASPVRAGPPGGPARCRLGSGFERAGAHAPDQGRRGDRPPAGRCARCRPRHRADHRGATGGPHRGRRGPGRA